MLKELKYARFYFSVAEAYKYDIARFYFAARFAGLSFMNTRSCSQASFASVLRLIRREFFKNLSILIYILLPALRRIIIRFNVRCMYVICPADDKNKEAG